LVAQAFGSAEFKAEVSPESAHDGEAEKLPAMIGQLVVSSVRSLPWEQG
jgi:hypothetical protein